MYKNLKNNNIEIKNNNNTYKNLKNIGIIKKSIMKKKIKK